MRTRVIFDGNNAAYRANVVTELCTSTGEHTSAIVGTLNIVRSTIDHLEHTQEYSPVSEAVVVWDYGHSPRRKALFPEYKANRKRNQTEEDREWLHELYTQIDSLYQSLPIFGVKSLRIPGWEGDDLILGVADGMVARHHDHVVIISTDEDFHQLISPDVSVYNPIRKSMYTYDNYQEKVGIKPEDFIGYKILRGDSSDGIPGIYGIGEKTAKSLMNTYGGLRGLLNPLNYSRLLKSKRTARIIAPEGLHQLDINNQLINLREYVDLSDVTDQLRSILDQDVSIDEHSALEYLKRWQLVSILSRWNRWKSPLEQLVKSYYE